MKTFITAFLSLLSFCCFSQILSDVQLNHYCERDMNGVIDLVVNEDVFYSASWESGEQSTHLEGLEPGIYTVLLVDVYGCSEEHEFEIVDISTCTLEVDIYGIPPNPFCNFQVTMHLYNQDGIEISPYSVDFYWPNGLNSQSAIINPLNSIQMSGVISASTNCCLVVEEFLPPSTPCELNGLGTGIVVNEIFFNNTRNIQFIELLVIGDGICGNTTDISNIIVDDNAGNMVPFSSEMEDFNETGNDNGYLKFSENEQWKNVENGSLIVIHNDNANEYIKVNDPNDSNKDNVYILNQNSNLFNFYNSYVLNGEVVYTENEITDIANSIKISDDIDGIQTRDQNYSTIHGVSYGSPQTNFENSFPLWITDEKLKNDIIIAEMEGDFYNKYAFQFKNITPSPGLANSLLNQDFRNGLLFCATPRNNNSNFIEVFPNPFYDITTVRLNTKEKGEFKITVLNNLGQVISENQYDLTSDNQFKEIQLNISDYTSGMYNIIVEFPSKQKQIKKILKIK